MTWPGRCYDVSAITHTGHVCYAVRHHYPAPQRTIQVTPAAHIAVVCIATPGGRILALAAMPTLHPAQQPPTIHLRLEPTT